MAGVVFVPPVAWLLTFTGWRAVWAFMGLLQLVVVLPLCWLVIRRRPEDVGLLPDGDPVADDGAAASPAGRRAIAVRERPEDRWTRGAAVRTPTFWLVALGFACTTFPGSGMFLHLVPYGQDQGLAAAAAALVLTSYSVGAMVARPVWAYVLDRVGIRRSMIAFALTNGVAIAAFILSRDIAAMYVTSFVVGLIAGATMPLQGQVWPDYFGRNIVGSLTGYATLIMTPAVALGPFAAAVAHDMTGSYLVVFTAFVAVSFLAGLCFFLAPRPAPPAALPLDRGAGGQGHLAGFPGDVQARIGAAEEV